MVARCLKKNIWGTKCGAFYSLNVREVGLLERIWYKLWREPTGKIEAMCWQMMRPSYYKDQAAFAGEWAEVDQSHKRK